MHANGTSTERLEGMLVPGVERAVGDVRRWLRDFLEDDPRLYDCTVCVSELMTNALRYTDSGRGGQILIKVFAAPERVRVEVTDDGGSRSAPRLRDPGGTEVRGRGLLIVDAMAAEWGVERVDPGHRVWFVVSGGR
ncbi:ATP-binding protein [Actinomadura vinacea]|uniref:ATP-binding protein n=1 Tax=Actinomadura vinacea TaxID=115336 RepID=A0ABP5XJS6_9ACTN